MLLREIPRRIGRSLSFRTRRLAYDVRGALLAARLAAARPFRSRDPEVDCVAIITVNWNTSQQLAVLLRAVKRFTPEGYRIIVVDNASTDDTHEMLKAHPEVTLVKLRRNYGHGPALDIGIHAARCRYIVTLDVDAFPISPNWLATVIDPLKNGYTLAGALSSGYIHPCFAAIERRYFLSRRYTFAASYQRRIRLPNRRLPRGWDVGKSITVLDEGPHFHVEQTAQRGPGALGTVFGDVVYHHFYSSRLTGKTVAPDVIKSGVTPELSVEAWDEAVSRYLG